MLKKKAGPMEELGITLQFLAIPLLGFTAVVAFVHLVDMIVCLCSGQEWPRPR